MEKKGKIEQKLSERFILDNELSIYLDHPRSFLKRLAKAFYYAWDAFKEMAKYLGIGFGLAAIISAFVPVKIITGYLGHSAGFDPILTAVPLAAAVELCSEGFSIFAGKLYELGATLGVTFVVMMVGVTTDFTELSVIWGKFGKKSALWYVFIATSVSLGMAHLLDLIF